MYATPKDMLAAFRRETNDLIQPYFWLESDVYQFMTQAELFVAQRTLCIQDMSSRAALYDVVIDQASVVFNQAVIRIRGATWLQEHDGVTSSFQLDIQSVDNMLARGCRIYETTGRPTVVMTGAVTNGLRLYPLPNADGQLVLAVYRVPLCPITAQSEFEVPFQYRDAMLEWMLYRAYSKEDAEAFDRNRADKHQRAFEYLIDTYTTMESLRRGAPQSGGVAYGGL